MNFLEQEITVTQIDLDDLNHVNNVIYVKWIQEIAKNHWRNLVSNEILNNYYWVLLEHQIQYHHRPCQLHTLSLRYRVSGLLVTLEML